MSAVGSGECGGGERGGACGWGAVRAVRAVGAVRAVRAVRAAGWRGGNGAAVLGGVGV